MFLAALIFSPTLEARLCDVQRSVFEQYDLSSALALPPMLPLHLSARPHQRAILRSLCRGQRPGLCFAGLVSTDDFLVAALSPIGEIDELRSVLSGRDEESGPCGEELPAGSEACPEDQPWTRSLAGLTRLPGVYLAYGEGRTNLDGAGERLSRLPHSRILATSLVDIRLSLYPEIGPWWEALAWEYMFEYRMKKRS
jgi:hypothetical protein